ncbi:MAG: riboflavin synthase [Deltaproteobacteria bacterium]|nr:riboflavin synthase [Deltaproteobacteria bacterium]
MFTGLIAAVGTVESGMSTSAGARFGIASPWNDLQLGESIAVDGVCLTVARAGGEGRFDADASSETLARSTLGRKGPGDRVHLERALRPGDRLGGHFVTGHVDAVGTVVEAAGGGGGTLRLTLRLPEELMRQVAPKGSIALDGVSLTVNEVRGAELKVMIVPHTARATKLGEACAGLSVNVETDVLAKYVSRMLGGAQGDGVTVDLLERCGFTKP